MRFKKFCFPKNRKKKRFLANKSDFPQQLLRDYFWAWTPKLGGGGGGDGGDADGLIALFRKTLAHNFAMKQLRGH